MEKDKKYSIGYVADILNITKAQAYSLIYKNKLGCVRFRGRLYVTESHLRNYVDALLAGAIVYKEKVLKNIAEIRNKNGHRLGYYSAHEGAKILGLSIGTMYKKINKGEFSPVNQGRSKVFPYGYFDAFCFGFMQAAQERCNKILNKLNKHEGIHG